MLKPLFINRPCYFDQSPGGECLRAFLEAMDKEKWQPTVFASDETPLVEPIPNYAHLTHEYRWVQYAAAAVRRVLPDLTFLPGYEWLSWGIGCKNSILKDIKNGSQYDYIHSVSFPIASHWAALGLKKATGLPWVMQYYDPWSENPYRRFKTRFLKKYDWEMERECIENADIIIHNNDAIAAQWQLRYGERVTKKTYVLPLTIPLPSTNVTPNTHKNEEPLTISHIGNFMLNRTSESFIIAVSELVNTHPEIRKLLKINYVGQVTEQEKKLILERNLKDIFNLVGIVSAEACVYYYLNSDVFLAIDGDNTSNLFFPSKLLKYFYFQRPILGVTPSGSVLDFELRNSNHCSLRNNDIAGISSYILKSVTDYESICHFKVDYYKKFLPTTVIDSYEKIINNLLIK